VHCARVERYEVLDVVVLTIVVVVVAVADGLLEDGGVGRYAAQVGRALPLQEGRRILASDPDDGGVG
jgi:hypothetical protein